MKLKIIGLVMLMLAFASNPALAQTGQNGSDVQLGDALNTDAEDVCAPINGETAICHGEVDDGTAVLVIESDVRQSVVLTDAGAFMFGGEIRRQTRVLQEGQNRIEFPVTVRRGEAGLSIDTGDVLFAVPLQEQTTILGGPYTVGDVQASALGAGASVGSVFLVGLLRRYKDDSGEPERVA